VHLQHEPDEFIHESRLQEIDNEIYCLREQADAFQDEMHVKETEASEYRRQYFASVNSAQNFQDAMRKLVKMQKQVTVR
jgi:hypothetical protein